MDELYAKEQATNKCANSWNNAHRIQWTTFGVWKL
jgi:hypothetical protein